jgi:hypothetical protein
MRKFIVCAATVSLAACLALMASKASAASRSVCQNYATRAVQEFHLMRRFQRCARREDARWQPHFDNHFRWCLSAPTAWIVSERDARDQWLRRCGAVVRID